jgi:CheY-like chemotaxis protein
MTSPQANQATVLVADNDPAIRAVLHELLAEDGYAVLEAADGAAALELLRNDARPFVVLLDHSLPKLDGIGLLRHVARDRHLRKRRAFILMTANRLSTRLATLRFLSMLQVPLLRKPFDIEQVEEAVDRAAASLRLGGR